MAETSRLENPAALHVMAFRSRPPRHRCPAATLSPRTLCGRPTSQVQGYTTTQYIPHLSGIEKRHGAAAAIDASSNCSTDQKHFEGPCYYTLRTMKCHGLAETGLQNGLLANLQHIYIYNVKSARTNLVLLVLNSKL